MFYILVKKIEGKRKSDISRPDPIRLITIYGWVKSGKIPSYNWNGAYRISDKELKTFIKAGRNNRVKVGT